MKRLVPLVIRPWMLPLIVAALVVPIIAGFYFAGPPLGLAAGALAVAVVLVLAARAQFDEPIEVPASGDLRYRLLVVADEPVDDPGLVEQIAEIADQGRAVLDRGQRAQVLVLAPARISLLDRWASDLGEAREAAARVLAISLAALAAAGLDASGRVGDPDPVQAISDELATFPAREVLLVSGPGLGGAEAREVGRRLDRPVRLLEPVQSKRPTSSA
jgi:hypothetical protein